MLNYDIGSNIGFVADQFNKQMDKTIMETKGEIESFCQNKINSIANAELVKKEMKFLNLKILLTWMICKEMYKVKCQWKQ